MRNLHEAREQRANGHDENEDDYAIAHLRLMILAQRFRCEYGCRADNDGKKKNKDDLAHVDILSGEVIQTENGGLNYPHCAAGLMKICNSKRGSVFLCVEAV
ncbi:hypothetical protein SB778_25405 [Paraburkholderia sp. SIMBA_050]